MPLNLALRKQVCGLHTKTWSKKKKTEGREGEIHIRSKLGYILSLLLFFFNDPIHLKDKYPQTEYTFNSIVNNNL